MAEMRESLKTLLYRNRIKIGASYLPSGGVASPASSPACGPATPPTPPPGFCPDCGAAFEFGDWVPADVVTIPSAETRLRVPNGQEVITIVGALELKTPPWANEMHEYPFLQWNMEVHQARLKRGVSAGGG